MPHDLFGCILIRLTLFFLMPPDFGWCVSNMLHQRKPEQQSQQIAHRNSNKVLEAHFKAFLRPIWDPIGH